MQFNSSLNRQESILVLTQATKEQKVQDLSLSMTRMSQWLCMMISMEYKGQRMKYQCGSIKRNSSVPPSHFLFSFYSFFYFFAFFGGLNGSFYLILICPLWDLLILSSLGSFPHFRGNTLYFTRIQEIFHTLQRYSHKEDVTIMMQMYASARVAGYAMILARHVAKM